MMSGWYYKHLNGNEYRSVLQTMGLYQRARRMRRYGVVGPTLFVGGQFVFSSGRKII